MKLREAFDLLLNGYPDGPELESIKNLIDEIVSRIDAELDRLEAVAQTLYNWGSEDLKLQVPISGAGEQARLLLKGLHTIKDACLLTVRH